MGYPEMARESKMTAVYNLSDGTTSKRVDPNATGITWTLSDGSTVNVGISELSNVVRLQAMLHGIKQMVGDAAAGKTSPDEIAEAMGGKIDLLQAGSFYAERGESGPRVSHLAQAIHDVKAEAGKLADGETVQSIAAKLAADESYKKRAAANAKVALRVETIREEARKARMATLKAEAKGAEIDDL